MSSTIHIPYAGDLYEIRHEGTLLTSIRKWYTGGQMVKDINFHSLPSEVQQELIRTIKQKKKKWRLKKLGKQK